MDSLKWRKVSSAKQELYDADTGRIYGAVEDSTTFNSGDQFTAHVYGERVLGWFISEDHAKKALILAVDPKEQRGMKEDGDGRQRC